MTKTSSKPKLVEPTKGDERELTVEQELLNGYHALFDKMIKDVPLDDVADFLVEPDQCDGDRVGYRLTVFFSKSPGFNDNECRRLIGLQAEWEHLEMQKGSASRVRDISPSDSDPA